MARHKRRRHRRFGDYVSVPLGFGKMKLPSLKALNPLGKHVASTDVLVGAFVGLAGGAGLRWAVNRFWPTAPAFLQKYLVPISVVGAGAATMLVLKNKSKAQGYFTGAALAGLVPLGWGLITTQFPALADYVSVNYGYPIDVKPMGLLVDEGRQRLSEMAAYAMGEEDDAYNFAP